MSSFPDHARGHMLLGYVEIVTKRAAQGIAECEHALALDRNLADAHAFIGFGKIYVGRAEETEAHVAEALRLSPRDTMAYTWMTSRRRREEPTRPLGGSDRVVSPFDRSQPELSAPALRVGKPPSRSSGGLTRRAPAVKAGLVLDPGFSVSRAFAANVAATAMSDDPTHLANLEPILDGMRKAGVPEE